MALTELDSTRSARNCGWNCTLRIWDSLGWTRVFPKRPNWPAVVAEPEEGKTGYHPMWKHEQGFGQRWSVLTFQYDMIPCRQLIHILLPQDDSFGPPIPSGPAPASSGINWTKTLNMALQFIMGAAQAFTSGTQIEKVDSGVSPVGEPSNPKIGYERRDCELDWELFKSVYTTRETSFETSRPCIRSMHGSELYVARKLACWRSVCQCCRLNPLPPLPGWIEERRFLKKRLSLKVFRS